MTHLSKPTLISGTQSTGNLHIGNYLGALKNFVELQNSGKYNCFFFIADYHSITIDFDPKKKAEEILLVARAYLAAGLDPKKSTLFVQSHIPASTELGWIFTAITPLGELERMTQFKDKMARQASNIDAGLLIYPALMAADIALYDAQAVPVGDDQLQHLELTRTIVRKFNNKFGKTFVEPQPLLTKTPRIMSLDDPTKKMSKTLPLGCLFLDSASDRIEMQIKSAVTDSGSDIRFDQKNKAGVSNLLTIYSALSGQSMPTLEKKYLGKGYGAFKAELIDVVTKALKPFRETKVSDAKIKTMLASGAKKAKKVAELKMKEVRKKIGLL
ncbi:MAG: tryptophan--tRNA ligase [bacterium]|nr:tryptophan--tRNA ligase [bacterium]